MTKTIQLTLLISVISMFGVVSCGPSLVIQDVNYSHPLESVLSPDSENMVYDQRYGIRFSVTPILEQEGASSVNEVRLIRNNAGYYFVTANDFRNVYVFEPGESELKLKTTIPFEEGVGEPAFNQRDDYIELVNLSTGETYNLNHEGIQQEEETQ